MTQVITETITKVPQHVAIIMDGNGRWAQQRGKTRVAGHKSGVESVRTSVSTAIKQGVKALTLLPLVVKIGRDLNKRSVC